jgi:hypothetical protein
MDQHGTHVGRTYRNRYSTVFGLYETSVRIVEASYILKALQ